MIELQNITLPDGFLREETRGGYTISAKMKEIWAVELDLPQCFIVATVENKQMSVKDSTEVSHRFIR